MGKAFTRDSIQKLRGDVVQLSNGLIDDIESKGRSFEVVQVLCEYRLDIWLSNVVVIGFCTAITLHGNRVDAGGTPGGHAAARSVEC